MFQIFVLIALLLVPQISCGQMIYIVTESNEKICASNVDNACLPEKNGIVKRFLLDYRATNLIPAIYFASPEVESLAREYGLSPDEEGNITVPISADNKLIGIKPEEEAARFQVPTSVVYDALSVASDRMKMLVEISRWKNRLKNR